MIKLVSAFCLFTCACNMEELAAAAASAAASSEATTSSKPASSAAAPAAAAGPNAPPADPLDDGGKPQASCDDVKKNGSCTEYYDLGMTEDAMKKLCDGDGATGKWEKGKTCPKESRVAVCRTDTTRMAYYKSFPWAPGNTTVEVGKLCTEGLMGKFVELPKK
jgi:hypothetical protein